MGVFGRFIREWAVLVAATLACLACADPPPTYVANSTGLGDGYCFVDFQLETPYAPGPNSGYYRVSGTNCNFSIAAYGVCHDGALMWVTQSSLTIGGETVTLPTNFDGGNVRFASTHFADSTNDLVVVWKAKFAIEDSVHNFSGNSDWVTVEFHLDPYNKGISYCTKYNFAGQLDLDALNNAWRPSAEKAKSKMEGLGHQMAPISGGVDNLGKSLINSWVSFGTFFYAITHGGPSGVYDSFQPVSQGFVEFSEIDAWTSGRTANNIPKFNCAIACDTLPNAGSNPLTDFHPTDSDSCYLGFPADVASKLAGGNTDEYVLPSQCTAYITKHVETLFDQWGGDLPMSLALDKANEDYTPRGYPVNVNGTWMLPALEMEWRGDADTTIHCVYLTADERDELPSETQPNWYHVWEN